MQKSEAECNLKKNGTCFSRLSTETRLSQRVTDLRKTAKSCGSSSHSVREALLREVNISLMTEARLKLMCEENKPAKAIKYVDAIRERDKAQKDKCKKREGNPELKHERCGNEHAPRRCPAFGKQGKNCEKNRTPC